MGKLRRIGTKALRSGSLFSQPEPLLSERILSVPRRCSCRPEVNIVVCQHPRTPSSSVPVRLRSRGEQGHPPSPQPLQSPFGRLPCFDQNVPLGSLSRWISASPSFTERSITLPLPTFGRGPNGLGACGKDSSFPGWLPWVWKRE